MERTCTRCGVARPVSMFYTETEERRSRKIGRQYTVPCRVCAKDSYNSGLRKRKRDHIEAVKLERGCADCGIRSWHSEIYDFDHRDPAAKSHTISSLITKGTMQDLVDEIAKCDVVCANCHRIRTKAQGSPSYGRARGPLAVDPGAQGELLGESQ